MYKIDKIFDAIIKINSDAKFAIRGDDINTCELEWHQGTTPISKADIEAKMNEMANEPEQSNYAEQRRNAYPPIGDQLDMLWHTIDKDILLQKRYFDFYQTIKQVKVKYPKT
jgi:hypothetical protein